MSSLSSDIEDNFPFEIERYCHCTTGQFVTESELDSRTDTDGSDYEYQVIKLDVTCSGYHIPGNTSGPMDLSYPEDGNCDIESALDTESNDWSDKLTDEEKNKIAEKFFDSIHRGSYHDDRCDDDLD